LLDVGVPVRNVLASSDVEEQSGEKRENSDWPEDAAISAVIES